ncbi:MAG: DUF2007 domain-containing protein [Proteobacteria bacterium]|nr:DUF2007 domain-containing protein [Pseudomonadota bacterium]
MEEVLRTNDPVTLSFAQSLLRDFGIEPFLMDAQTSAIEGSIGAIQRRIMVIAEDADEARALLQDADLLSRDG